MNSELSEAITKLYTFGLINEQAKNHARKKLLAIAPDEPVSYRYKLGEDGNGQGCFACGCGPIDFIQDPWASLPWIVTLKESGHQLFLIDRRDEKNTDMFSGFKIIGNGSIGNGISATTGSGGRLNLHRSHFEEDLPA